MDSSAPRPVDLLRGALLPDGRLVDVAISGDTVTEVAPAGTLHGSVDGTLDLAGRLLVTAPAEPHAHLDKALSADAIRPPLGDLGAAIASWSAHATTMTVDEIAERARTAALTMLAAGTTAVRSHVDVLSGRRSADDAPAPVESAVRGAQALVRVRDELAGLMDLELVALAGPLAPDHHVEAVLACGVDLVGGAPHLAEDPLADVDRLLALADRHGVGVDLHTDENLDGPVTLDHFARAVTARRDSGTDGRTWTAGHCVRLGTLGPERRAEVVADVAAADLGIVTLPITNLYLQGWQHPVSTPRGLTAIQALTAAGVRVAAGADNVRDPFNPVGRSDALETASLLVTAGHVTPDQAYAMVSDTARSVMGLPAAGPVPGRRADLLAIAATSVTDAVANAPADRIVLSRGRLVARTEVRTTVAAAAAPVPA